MPIHQCRQINNKLLLCGATFLFIFVALITRGVNLGRHRAIFSLCQSCANKFIGKFARFYFFDTAGFIINTIQQTHFQTNLTASTIYHPIICNISFQPFVLSLLKFPFWLFLAYLVKFKGLPKNVDLFDQKNFYTPQQSLSTLDKVMYSKFSKTLHKQ